MSAKNNTDGLVGEPDSERTPYRAFQTDAYAVKFANKKLEPITQKLPEAQKRAGAGISGAHNHQSTCFAWWEAAEEFREDEKHAG